MTGTSFTLEAQPSIPARLARLQELANDLLYSWDRHVRGLFIRLDRELWTACGHNPKLFLRRVSQRALDEAEQDRGFIGDYNRVVSSYDTYLEEKSQSGIEPFLAPGQDLVAYFCAEFGFHESFSIYSGGLGILAGDHCKAASDLGVPFVAVGLLYRQGYFTQTIDSQGRQIAHPAPVEFSDLPVSPAQGAKGEELRVSVELPGREVQLRVWQVKAGHIRLYLLDSDLSDNREADRSITFQLYGGDIRNRIQQEMVLGIGGVRALHALGLKPTVWHINEGHAALMILERCCEYVEAGMDFPAALELTAAGTVFTTHTPVQAGHDVFERELAAKYLGNMAKRLHVELDVLLELGASPANNDALNMTALALRGSRFHNGVSRIHGSIASRMESYIWPQIPPEENPIGYVTNGVHLPTVLAREWANLFHMRFREWHNELLNETYWNCIDQVPDLRFWSLRQELKSTMLNDVRCRVVRQLRRNDYSKAHIERATRLISQPDNDVLVLGFARRFATYKRATMLFGDPERLARLLNDTERPVLLIFAGKAHPHDQPAQDLIRVIHNFSQANEFIGKIILLEGYDMAIARRLFRGVDVWLNTPQYPLEASGTSGQKAGVNGALNLSVLDGWWGEGYNGKNGWAITPHDPEMDAQNRDRIEASELLDILEQRVIPQYFRRDRRGYSPEWVRLSKNSMKSLIPRFNSQRMCMDYVRDYYAPARAQFASLTGDNGAPARELAHWKQKIRECWGKVRMEPVTEWPAQLRQDETLPIRLKAYLNGLDTGDVTVECLVGREGGKGFKVSERVSLSAGASYDEWVEFSLDLRPPLSGLQQYKLRMYPSHPLLSHPFETGRMIWL